MSVRKVIRKQSNASLPVRGSPHVAEHRPVIFDEQGFGRHSSARGSALSRLSLFGGLALLFALALRDQLRLGQKRRAEPTQDFQEKVDLRQTLPPLEGRAQAEFEVDATPAVGQGEHAVTAPVLPALTRLDFGQHVRGEAGRGRRQECPPAVAESAHPSLARCRDETTWSGS